MQRYGISQLPVVRRDPPASLTDVIGSLNERGLLDRVFRNPDSLGEEVAGAMDPPLHAVDAGDSVRDVYGSLSGTGAAVLVAPVGRSGGRAHAKRPPRVPRPRPGRVAFCRAEVALIPLTEDERQTFLHEEVAGYADQQVRDAGWPRREALDRARAEITPVFERELAEAVARGDRMWSARAADGQSVGWLWVKPIDGASASSVFLEQITVAASRRRQGYGRAMLEALEQSSCCRWSRGAATARLRRQPGRTRALRGYRL